MTVIKETSEKKLEQITNTGAEIQNTPPCSKQIKFNHSIFTQVGLPRSRFHGDTFLRQNGNTWISVKAGFASVNGKPVQQFVPFGSLPRLALAHISSVAVKTKSPIIDLGNSAGIFLENIGQARSGQSYRSLTTQMRALAACTMQFGCDDLTINSQPIQSLDLWTSKSSNPQQDLWGSTLTLSDSYYNSLIEAAVPMDLRALNQLKQSAFALDIYFWLSRRLYNLNRAKRVTWKNLLDQFGQEYQGPQRDKNFKKQFLFHLKHVLAVYPQANVTIVTTGIMLKPSDPVIPRKQDSLPF